MVFKKQELKALVIIFSILILAIALNLRVSLRKSRDSQRKSDVRSIHDTLFAFKEDFGSFPLSTLDGKIVACNAQTLEDGSLIFEPCQWLTDALPPYLVSVPTDPNHSSGRLYRYISNGRRFQIFGSLESKDEDEFDLSVIARSLECGNQICNFGKGSKDTPLDKSLEEYENEIREKELELIKQN